MGRPAFRGTKRLNMAGRPKHIHCMSVSFKAACIQSCATPDVAHNLEVTLRLTREAAAAGADLVCLPEYFSGVETRDGLFHPAAFPKIRTRRLLPSARRRVSLAFGCIWVP